MGALALAILKANWKWIAVAIAVGGLLAYIQTIKLERDHYKKNYTVVTLKLETLVKDAKVREDKLAADNEAITKKYQSTLKDANTLTTENARINAENIKNAQELASVRLSYNAVRLFNASKPSTTKDQKASPTVSGNDGTATSVAKALEVKSQTLADLLQVVNENDANHQVCIDTVTQWQQFWTDYEQAVMESERNAQ